MDTDAPVCTICQVRPVREKKKFLLYGVYVCRKCLYRLANRRQVAFIVDSFAFSAVMFLITLVMGALVRTATPGWVIPDELGMAISLLGLALFAMKDGISGQSPGKRLLGVQVVDVKTMEPIGFSQSFVRNIPIVILYLPNTLVMGLASVAPALGAIASGLGALFQLIGLLIIASRLVKGPRWGDGWAGTKVVLKKCAFRPPFDLRGEACTNCGYNLRGNISGICPECGTGIISA